MNFRIIPIALSAPVLVAAAPLSGDLAAVQAHLTATRALTADFTQTDRQGQVLGGTLTMKQPGKIRFQYGNNVPMLIIADGKTLYFVDYAVKQVSSWPIANSPLAVFLDPARNVARYTELMPSADPRIISVQAWDKKRPEYGRINLVFARDGASPGGLKLTGWVALDAQGNRTTVRLTNQQYNGAVGDETFRWNDPRSKKRAR